MVIRTGRSARVAGGATTGGRTDSPGGGWARKGFGSPSREGAAAGPGSGREPGGTDWAVAGPTAAAGLDAVTSASADGATGGAVGVGGAAARAVEAAGASDIPVGTGGGGGAWGGGAGVAIGAAVDRGAGAADATSAGPGAGDRALVVDVPAGGGPGTRSSAVGTAEVTVSAPTSSAAGSPASGQSVSGRNGVGAGGVTTAASPVARPTRRSTKSSVTAPAPGRPAGGVH